MKKAVLTIILITSVHYILMALLSFVSVAEGVAIPSIWNAVIITFSVITLFPIWLIIWNAIQQHNGFIPYFVVLGLYSLLYGSVVYIAIKRITRAIKHSR